MQYYERYEHRKPYRPNGVNLFSNLAFQFFGIGTLICGIYYITERINNSINTDAYWLSFPLVFAETLSMIGTILFVLTLWENKKVMKQKPVKLLSEIERETKNTKKYISIDMFITTYNEEISLLKHTLRDCKKIKYDFSEVKIKIYVLDDGRRNGENSNKENVKKLCQEEKLEYITRDDNTGYKAGNLRNGIEKTNGDIIVILDADTRVFPELLNNTTGYFRNEKIAWVQTPQWFYDIPNKTKIKKKNIFALIQNNLFSNSDPLGNETQGFYDSILRRRNYYNAAFCCGAGSLHRRSALMETAVKDFSKKIKKQINLLYNSQIQTKEIKKIIYETTISPFQFHASEDIYTSLLIHGDNENKWESLQHADVECKMLSTQNLDDKIKQHQRYAEGTLDIALHVHPIFKKGLSLGQKICYAATIWSYLSPIWITIFILCPILYFFSLTSPINIHSSEVMKYFIAFQIFNTISHTIAFWGINTTRTEQYYISGFWYLLQSLIKVFVGNKINFHVTPKTKTQSKNLKHILPHLLVIAAGTTGIVYNIYLIKQGIHPDIRAFWINTIWFCYTGWSFSAIIKAAIYKQRL